MGLSLPAFDHFFTERSIERAGDYFDSDAIKYTQLTQGSVDAIVYGSFDYRVRIRWDQNDYTALHCTCPYDHGGYCKHIAAVLLQLVDSDVVLEELPDPIDWREIFQNADKEQLVNLLCTAIEHFPRFESHANLILNGDEVDYFIEYSDMIESLIDDFTDKYGYVDYDDTFQLGLGLSSILQTAEDTEDDEMLIAACMAMIRRANSLLLFSDDSAGNIGMVIEESFDEIKNRIVRNNFKNTSREYLFYLGMKVLTDENIYEIDAGTTMWNLLASAVRSDDELDTLVDVMKNYVNNCSGWSNEYATGQMNLAYIEALKVMGRSDEVEQFIDDNVQCRTMRDLRIDQLLQDEKWSEVKVIVQEALDLEIKKGGYNTNNHLYDILLEIAEVEGDSATIKEILRPRIHSDRYSSNDYRLFKKQFDNKSWKIEINQVINTLKKGAKSSGNTNGLLRIYRAEKMYEALFCEVFSGHYGFRHLDEYREELMLYNPKATVDAYIKLIESLLANNMGRKYYQEAVGYIRWISDVGYSKLAQDVTSSLRKEYANRPALQDEFRGL